MIKREMYMERIRPFIGKDIVKVLTGIRRAGKSVLLEQIRDEIDSENTIFLNFEDLSNQHLCEYNALHDFVCKKIGKKKGKFYLFFDEIQEVEGWEKAINSLRVKFNADIYVTGSNSKLLSGEFATYIAGRYVSFVIYPFSFAEFKDLNSDYTFNDYIKYGGMPFLASVNFEPEVCKNYLQDVYNSVVLKDIVKRNKIRDVDLLERIIAYILANIGQTFSATNIAKYFKSEQRKVSTDTVLNYVKACESAYLFYKLKRQNIKGKKILAVQEKYYVADHGIREAVYGKNSEEIERVLENIVCLELLRCGYKVTVGIVDEVKEIDFIAEKNNEPIYIQVCYLLSDEKTRTREFENLNKIADNFPKFVISMDEIDMSRNGIKHINIRDFLLSKILK